MSESGPIFRALADATRREILQALEGGDRAAGEIAALFAVSAPSISRHLSILAGAGLVTHRRQGNRIIYRLEAERLARVLGAFLGTVSPPRASRRKGRSGRGARARRREP
jgi:DNA-binding transcriptional ArsR family regulator